MTEINIRDKFHDIFNILNDISTRAGVTYRELKKQNESTGIDISSLVKVLSDLEEWSLKAGKSLVELKDEIYKLIDPGKKMTR